MAAEGQPAISRSAPRRAAAGILALGLLAGAGPCGRPPEPAASAPDSAPPLAAGELGGTSWRLVEFQGGDDTILRPDERAKYTLGFEPDGRLHARIDCNRGRGSWRSSGPPQLEFGPLALTRAQCPPGSLHDRIVRHWPYVRSYLVRDGHLFLSLMADGGIYEFEPAPPAAGEPDPRGGVPLERTYWKLVEVGGAAVQPASPRVEAHLIFDPDTRRVSGSGGCNRIAGSYERAGERLDLRGMAGTMMACAQAMETETAFFAALERVHGWRVADRQLELLDPAGQVVARLEAAHAE
jgi:heat shock protein HslJ